MHTIYNAAFNETYTSDDGFSWIRSPKPNLRRLWNRFTKTAYVMDMRVDAQAQHMAAIKRKAARFETLRHTAGKLSDFGASLIAEEVHIMRTALAYNL